MPNRFSLAFTTGNTTIICLYIPPSLQIDEVQSIFDSLPLGNNTIICGDLNARLGPLTGDRITNTRVTLLKRWITHRNLTVWNATLALGIPTYHSFRNDQHMTSITLLPHFKLIDTPTPIISPPPQRRLWNLSRLAEEEPRQLYIDTFISKGRPLLTQLHFLTDSPPVERPDIDDLADQLNQTIYDSLSTALGERVARPKHWKWFWNEDLQTKSHYRDNCFRRWKRSHGIEAPELWDIYQTAHHSLRRAVKAARRQAWRSYCDAMERDFTKATSTIKRLRRACQPSHTFTHSSGPTAAADIMVRHLASVCDGHLLPTPRRPQQPSPSTPTSLDACSIDSDTVTDAIHKLPNRKAPGPGHIRAEMLKPLGTDIAQILSVMFRLCWQWTYITKLWRQAHVCPIFKKGDPTMASNYRPISLISIFRKTMEICLAPIPSLNSPPVDLAQGGFRPRRSAMDQALCLQEIMSLYHIRHRQWPVIAFLDIKAAYDTVDRQIIWDALAENNAPSPFLALLSHMFNDVSICVLLENHLSSEATLTTGVLQGSVLSPQLYSIYINSLPEVLRRAVHLTTPRVGPLMTPINPLLFADDVAIVGTSTEVQLMLQLADSHSIDLGYRWSPTKCAILNAPTDSDFQLYGTSIPKVDEFVYLGVPFHHDGMSSKAMFQHRKPGTFLAVSTLRAIGARRTGFSLLFTSKVYKLFVCPKFEYGLAISRVNSQETRMLERMQDSCLRQFFGGHATSSTAVYKHICDIPYMSERLDVLRTKYCLRYANLPPPDCLVRQLTPLLSANRIYYLRTNPLYRSIPTPFLPEKLPDLITSRRLIEYQRRCNDTARPPILLRACRPAIGVDPILKVPATRTERSLMIRWRMGWLPRKPKPCPCDPEHQHTSRNHLPTCPHIPSNLWQQLLIAPADVNPIDHALSSIPDIQHPCPPFWSAFLTILQHVDQICLPDATFPMEPSPGALWHPTHSQPEPP